ncbi:hypothetical protein IGI39_004019 [Enterococcus sp. AZ135]|uniref:hypothetical protein n=1 Tax=unclassified Enterococcus TaxID=2608891 RepID=UPI003F287EB6
MELEEFTKGLSEKELQVFFEDWESYKKKREQLLKNRPKKSIGLSQFAKEQIDKFSKEDK